MTYRFGLENLEKTYPEFEPMYRTHYAEMTARLERDGIRTAPFAPRLDQYFAAVRAGYLLHYTARTDQGEAVGYCNVYLTSDMHNGELMAREDLLYVVKPHRNGVGKNLVKFGLADLKARGVQKLLIQPVTDLRVGKIWKRMGFREVSSVMVYQF